MNYCIIWEKNGLRHGQFVIESENEEVQEIEWCKNSEMVLMVLRNDDSYRVCVYVRSNYKWMMKCCILGRSGEQILRVEMGELNRNRLMIFYEEGVIEELELEYEHDGDRMESGEYYLSIDNHQVHITHF